MPQEVSKVQLSLGYWLLNHRRQLRKIGLVIFIIIDAVIVLLFLYNLTIYLANIPGHNRMIESMGSSINDYRLYHQKTAPLDLQIIETEVLRSPLEKYDFIAKIKNPNDRWIITGFRYRFLAGGAATEWSESYLANNEEKYLLYFGLESSQDLLDSRVQVEIEDLAYRRVIDPDKVPDVNFLITNADYNLLTLDEERISQVTADIRNDSVYSFWQVGIQIVLRNSGQPVGVNYTTIDSFDTLQTKEIDLKWRGRLSGVNQVEIIPEINIIDNDNYKKYNIAL